MTLTVSSSRTFPVFSVDFGFGRNHVTFLFGEDQVFNAYLAQSPAAPAANLGEAVSVGRPFSRITPMP